MYGVRDPQPEVMLPYKRRCRRHIAIVHGNQRRLRLSPAIEHNKQVGCLALRQLSIADLRRDYGRKFSDREIGDANRSTTGMK